MRKTAFFSLVIIVIMLAGCGDDTLATMPAITPGGTTGAATAKAGSYEQSLDFEGQKRTYLLHLPPAVSKGQPLPLVLAFHGSGGQAKGMQALTGFSNLADQKGFIVVYPDAYEGNWNDGRQALSLASQRENINDVGFVEAIIERLANTYPLDRRRVFATGMSNGGMFTQRLGCELAGKLAAIAPVTGSLPENFAPLCKPTRPLPVLMIMGTADSLVPWQGGEVVRGRRNRVISVPDTIKFWATHNQCAPTPAITREPDRNPSDGTQVRREAYSQCRDNTEVVLYAVEDGGHAWPGSSRNLGEAISGKVSQDINASEIIWDFFSKH